MINLIEGGFFAGGHEMIKEKIKLRTENKQRSILIVPDQQTVSQEKEMTEYLPDYAPLYFEATNFTRFANSVFRALGGLSGNAADKRSKALVMWRTLTELAPALSSMDTGAAVCEGSVTRMLGAVADMQSRGVCAAELADLADSLSEAGGENARLISKLRDLSMIMIVYKKLLSEHFSDSQDTLALAASKLASCGGEFISDTEIFIDGFTSFTEPQYKLISELITLAPVTVSLTIPKSAFDAFEYTEIREAHKKLVKLASERGIDATLTRIDGRGAVPLMISEVATNLWRSSVKIDTDAYLDTDALHIYEAENPYEECNFVADDIKRRVMEGAKYSDFGIISRNIDSYSGILNISFKKANIPLFMSKRSDIGSYEAIKLISSAIAVINGGYERRDVIAYAKCSLSGVPRDLADELEIYTDRWQIFGKRFTDGVMWNMNPDGYTSRRRDGTDEKLLKIDRARNAVITPLVELEEALNSSSTVTEYAKALMDFLIFLNIEDQLRKKSRDASPFGEYSNTDDLSRLWQTICDALDSMVDILGPLKVTRDAFAKLISITLLETNIGRIPAFCEEVTAGSADTARMYGKKYIYILGANANVFPMAIDDDSYFTDKDKRTMESAGLNVSSDTNERSARELYLFSRAISYARVGVNIVYSSTNDAFKPIPPSDAVKRITELTGERIKPQKVSEIPPSKKLYTAEYALDHINPSSPDYSQIRTAVAKAGLEDRLTVSEKPIGNANLWLSKESLARLYGKSIPMSQSKIEAYVKCPMNYFCQYDLRLEAEERAEFDSRNIGTFLHAILENFFCELKARGIKIGEISEDDKRSMITRVAENYVKECSGDLKSGSARLKDSINKLSRAAKPVIDSLCDEFSGCSYEPIFFELSIEKNKDGLPSPIIFNTDNGNEVYITGKIDRVDRFISGDDAYIRVIDYKSGRKVFSPSDIEKGLNLQMFLYLKAVVESENKEFRSKIGVSEGGRMIPAGVLYVKTAIDDSKIARNSTSDALSSAMKKQERLGMLLNDEVSLGAMNSKYIPIKFKTSDGLPDSRSEKKLYTETDWDNINRTISEVLVKETSKMVSGNITASPLLKSGKSEACKYCEFKAVCRSAKTK